MKIRDTSFQMPAGLAAAIKASIATRPAPRPRDARATYTENSAMPA
jgi:hypothetical protein